MQQKLKFFLSFSSFVITMLKRKSSEKTQIQKDTFSFHLESIPSQNLFLRDEIVEDL
jgi:hypothetical protein